MARYRSYRDLDWPLLLITLIICGLGVLQIYSATRDTRWEDAWWKQLIWIGIALLLSVPVTVLNPVVIVLNVVVVTVAEANAASASRPCRPLPIC